MRQKLVGQSAPRLEDRALLIGAGRFVDDIELPGMLHACFLRSPHAHAAIVSVDCSAARAMEGVTAVYSFADLRPHMTADRLEVALPSSAFRQKIDRPILAIDEVAYVGEPVAVVVACTRYQAEDAIAAIDVVYEQLVPVLDCAQAVAAGAPLAHRAAPHNVVAELDLQFGDIERAFGGAPHVFHQVMHQTRGGSHSMECRGYAASYSEVGDQLTVWSSTQTPHASMRLIAQILGREESSVRVITPDVGGGFGPKLVFYGEELVVALAARLLGRPVKWIEDRREHFISATQEREQIWDVAIAVEADGTIRGVRGTMLHDHGAYTARGINVAFEAMQAMTMPYDVPACRLDVTLALTNKVPVTPVRGAGQPQGVFAMERLLDRVAGELGLDRAVVRRRNLVQPAQMPHAKPFKTRSGIPVTIDSGDFPACLDKAMSMASWNEFAGRRMQAREQGRLIGIGIAAFVELTGRGPYEPATVRISPSGTIHVLSSAAAMGQSTATMLAQIVADQLGGDLSNIIVTTGDSSSSTTGFGGFGSRQAVTAGSSAHVAAQKVRAKALAIAGCLLEVSPDDLDITGGQVHVKGASQLRIGLGDIAKASLGIAGVRLPGDLPPGLEASEAFIINEMAYTNGTAIATVEVDIETGSVKLLDYVMAHDCGNVIHPIIVDGQILGGIAHGIGNALYEKMHFDVAGQPLTTTLADYLLPTAPDMPSFRLEHLETPSPLNPLGIKGVGESGVLPTPAAIIGAIEDALSDYDVRIDCVPVSPEQIVAMVVASCRKSMPSSGQSEPSR